MLARNIQKFSFLIKSSTRSLPTKTRFYFSSQSSDIIDDIIKDHREVETLYKNYKLSSNMEEGHKWFNLFLWELCRHSVAEEMVMYNMLEAVNEKGKELGERSRQDHRHLKVLLEDLRLEKDDKEFDRKFDNVVKVLLDHVKMEESEDLPFLKEHVSLDQRQKAAAMFAFKKKIAPTRPHPEIPDKPTTLEAVLGMLAAPVDKMKDMFTSYPNS